MTALQQREQQGAEVTAAIKDKPASVDVLLQVRSVFTIAERDLKEISAPSLLLETLYSSLYFLNFSVFPL